MIHEMLQTRTKELKQSQERVAELEKCLLWLRNHYDVGPRSVKSQVLGSVDAVLAKNSRYPIPFKEAIE